jgi:hypothetical protein
MARWWIFGLVLFAALVPAFAGDEDVRVERPRQQAPEPEPTPFPEPIQAPGMKLWEEEEPEVQSPQFQLISEEEEAPTRPMNRGGRPSWDPDRNLNYGELMGHVEPAAHLRGVLPPALGARGYRPSLLAVGYGDRTPGYGAMVEYSWNRLGAGLFYSYRPLRDADRFNYSQSFGGLYLVYRWLPFAVSPYILAGVQLASRAPEAFGGMAGAGIEARVYNGWTVLLGYTYHSTAQKGFFGGAFGWTF